MLTLGLRIVVIKNDVTIIYLFKVESSMKETTMGDWIPTEEIGDMVDFLGGFPT